MMKYTYLNDKYFTNLDDFNKNLIPHKSNFFKDCQGFSFSNLLKSLSYNIDISTKNYRWGKRYFNKDNNDFVWVTSNNNKKISKLIWNSKTHQYENIDVTAYFTDDMIKNHFLSCFLKNRKIKFFYNLTPQNKDELKNHHIALDNMYRVDGKTFGSTQQIGSDILLIDIDNYEERSAIETLSMFLDYVELNVSDLLYIEQNVFTGGIHTAIKLPQKITNVNFYPQFMKELANNDIKIECNFINNILRFPLSFEYVALKHDESILYYNEFVPQKFWEESFDSYLENMNQTPCYSHIITNLIEQTHNTVTSENKYENYWTKKRNIILRNNKVSKSLNNYELYKIENGNRYDTMSKLVPFCKLQGMSLEETVKTIFEQNVSSKDLSKWSFDKLKNNIRKFYDNCPNNTIKATHNCGFISNIDFLPTQTKEFLDSDDFKKFITNRFIKFYLEERNKHNANIKNISKEKREILYKQIPYIITEIIGKMFYEIHNSKSFVKGINERLGFQLPDAYLKAIQEQSIKDLGITSSLGKTSLQYLKKAILKSLSLEEIQYKNRKRNWMLGSCKSFSINSLNDITILLNHLHNSIFKKLITAANYKIIILYILLGGKPMVSDDVLKTFLKYFENSS